MKHVQKILALVLALIVSEVCFAQASATQSSQLNVNQESVDVFATDISTGEYIGDTVSFRVINPPIKAAAIYTAAFGDSDQIIKVPFPVTESAAPLKFHPNSVYRGDADSLPVPSSIEDDGVNIVLNTTTGSFVLPRMTEAERLALTPVIGSKVYQTNGIEGEWIFKSTGWQLRTAVSQNLNEVSQLDSSLHTTVVAYSKNGKDTLLLRDSIVRKVNGSAVTAINQVGAKLLEQLQDEKFNTNDPAGKKYGRYNKWLIWNNYNGGPSSTKRRGFVRTEGYNVTGGGGAEITNEGYFQTSLETDYERSFEWYHQVGGNQPSTGPFSYRPIMIRAWKDTMFNDFAMRTSFLHVSPIAVANNYFKAENGKTAITNVVGQPSPSPSNTILNFERDNAGAVSAASITYNGASLIFGGASSYVFGNNMNPQFSNTFNNGANSAKWLTSFTNAMVVTHKSVPDDNYTILSTDYTVSFKNITADRTVTLPPGYIGRRIELVSGQNAYKVTFAGVYKVKNTDGTYALALPAGKSCTLVFSDDNTSWQVVAVGSAL